MLPVKTSKGEEGKAEQLHPVPPTGSACPSYLWPAGGAAVDGCPLPAEDAVGNDLKGWQGVGQLVQQMPPPV